MPGYMVFYRNNYDNILIILTPSMVTLLVYDKYHIPRHGRATRWESLLNSYTTQRIHLGIGYRFSYCRIILSIFLYEVICFYFSLHCNSKKVFEIEFRPFNCTNNDSYPNVWDLCFPKVDTVFLLHFSKKWIKWINDGFVASNLCVFCH